MDLIESSQILHAVKVMIQRFGENAPVQAAIRARELSDLGDSEGAQVWQQVEVELLSRLTEQSAQHTAQH